MVLLLLLLLLFFLFWHPYSPENIFLTAEAIREGVQIVEDDEWEEEEPPVPTNRNLSPEFRFPRPPSAEGSFGSFSRLYNDTHYT